MSSSFASVKTTDATYVDGEDGSYTPLRIDLTGGFLGAREG